MELHLMAENVSQVAGGIRDEKKLFSVSFDWKGAQLHTIMGISGCGKSSLLKTLGGVWERSGGRLEIANLPFNSNQAQNLRKKQLGYAFQNNALFNSLTNFENLAFPHRLRYPEIDEARRHELVVEWFAKVELQHAVKLFPHELSGGMQKRLGIARAMILEPRYIFLDDPTAGLDPITARSIAELLGKLLSERESLSVLVTNDMDRAQQWGGELHFLHQQKLVSKDDPEFAKVLKDFQ
jgi:phospholipid/cholesterol/gamma-HCH transport system ATP-binding protein